MNRPSRSWALQWHPQPLFSYRQPLFSPYHFLNGLQMLLGVDFRDGGKPETSWSMERDQLRLGQVWDSAPIVAHPATDQHFQWGEHKHACTRHHTLWVRSAINRAGRLVGREGGGGNYRSCVRYISANTESPPTLSSEADSVTKLMMNTMKMTWLWRRMLSRQINGF